ncbi:MAG: response regulator [Saprospiraceae bacterium]|nr:response regulator [Saprospiraceae bacterium]
MSDFHFLIVEDEELYATKLEMLVEKLGYSVQAQVDNSADALTEIQKQIPDIILMDINIEGEYDGIELADMIHQKHAVPIIFITSLEDERTFKRASRTGPVGFIIKPFNDIQLQRSVEIVLKHLHQNLANSSVEDSSEWKEDLVSQKEFFIKTRNQLEKVVFTDILFVEADGRYCKIQTLKKKYLVRIPMSELIGKLPANYFQQSHRSFLVNIEKVSSVNLQDNILLLGDMHVPLSIRKQEAFLQRLNLL